MRGQRKNANVDWAAARLLDRLMADRGWTPRSVEAASARTGHPQRRVSMRVVYRVVSEGHKPTNPIQFEIAATFGLLPSHIWGDAAMPEGWPDSMTAATAVPS